MKESCRKGVASRPGPESCVTTRKAGIEALTVSDAIRASLAQVRRDCQHFGYFETFGWSKLCLCNDGWRKRRCSVDLPSCKRGLIRDTIGTECFCGRNHRGKDGKDHTYWSLVETVRTPDGPRQRTVCYLGELNGSVEGALAETVEVFNGQGEARQLKLFPSHVAPPEDDPQVARVLVNGVRLERTRQFGACFLGLELWKRLELDRFFEQFSRCDPADVPWSRVAALLAINRLCAPGSELAIEQRWYPSTALDDLLGIEEGKINDTRLYRCLDRILPHKTKLERHLKARYGALFGAEFDVLALRSDEHVCGRGGGEESDGAPRLLARSPSRLRAVGDRADRQQRRFPVQLRNLRRQPHRCLDHGNDSAHGGAQVRQGAEDLGIRSRHRERGESGGHPQARRPVSGGHAAQPDEAV